MKNAKEVTDFLSNLSHITQPNAVCESRTIYSLNWYSRKANFNKYLFYTLSIINIVAPLLDSKKFASLKKPVNPNGFLTYPVSPE